MRGLNDTVLVWFDASSQSERIYIQRQMWNEQPPQPQTLKLLPLYNYNFLVIFLLWNSVILIVSYSCHSWITVAPPPPVTTTTTTSLLHRTSPRSTIRHSQWWMNPIRNHHLIWHDNNQHVQQLSHLYDTSSILSLTLHTTRADDEIDVYSPLQDQESINNNDNKIINEDTAIITWNDTNIIRKKSSRKQHSQVWWQMGDIVQINPIVASSSSSSSVAAAGIDVPLQYGIIRNISHGWYTIELLHASSSNNTQLQLQHHLLIKCRAKQLQSIPSSSSKMASPWQIGWNPKVFLYPNHTTNDNNHTLFIQSSSSPLPKLLDESTPRIIDLDQLLLQYGHTTTTTSNKNSHQINMEVAVESTTMNMINHTPWDMEQLQYFQSVSTWIVFSDLHCSVHTIETCVQVLKYIHDIAQQQQQYQGNSGILFLGDFWHIRSHTIRIDLLHRILTLFQQYYTIPMILIPGNHDQISSSLSSSSSSSIQPPPQLHSLTPFQNAYRIPIRNTKNNTTTTTTTTTVNGILILDEPTKFMNALFIPHIRNPVIMENIFKAIHHDTNPTEDRNTTIHNNNTSHLSSKSWSKTNVIFCHVDVTGASMNDNIVSQGGISIHTFPPNIPIYSGHFHKPHNVTSSSSSNNNSNNNQKEIRRVEYIGSPYQVSLSESQQSKGIIILNATNGWECIDRIPMTLGRRHYRLQTVHDFLSLRIAPSSSNVSDGNDFVRDEKTNITNAPIYLKTGDRVVLSIQKHEMDQLQSVTNAASNADVNNVLDGHIALLRNSGVVVEIREVNTLQQQQQEPQSSNIRNTNEGLVPHGSMDRVDMSPSTLWSTYVTQQVQRGVISPTNEEMILRKGKEIIDELGSNGMDTFTATSERNSSTTNGSIAGNFQLHSVSLRGFGPFCEKVSYPLFNRGLVLLRGSNKDGGSDSNGSGKTSLAMSILWAFTGSIDPRPLQDSKVVDVINDASKSATVTVEGMINGIKFSITRTKTSNRGSLVFFLDDVDVTRQAIKDTQDMINEKLGINPQVLARTMFNGQHALNELLEASDTRLKDELSLVVPLSIWQNALQESRHNLREISKRISELDGMISVRSDDAAKLKRRFDEAESAYETENQNHKDHRILLEGEIANLSKSSSFSSLRNDSFIIDMPSLENDLLHASDAILNIEQELGSTYDQRIEDLKELELSVDSMKSQISKLDIELKSLTVEYNKVALSEALAKDRIVRLQEMWKLDLSEGLPDPFVLPQNCPTCQQLISSQTKNDEHTHLESTIRSDVEESLAQLTDVQSSLCRVQDAIENANSTKLILERNATNVQNIVNEKRKLWDDTIKHIEHRLHEARLRHQESSFRLSEAARKINEQSNVASLRAKIAASKELLDQTAQRVDQARTEWKEYEQLVDDLNVERSNHVEMSRIVSDLCDAFGTRGIQSFIMHDAVSTLEAAAQTYLDELSDGAQKLRLSLDSNDCIVRKAYVRGENGLYKERALASLSGGQWRRCSLAFTLAFAELVANRANFRPSLIVLDEPLMHLDQSGRSNVGRLLRRLLRRESEQYDTISARGFITLSPSTGLHVSTILIILQDLAAEELEESFDAIDEVVKENGSSSVYIDE